GLNRLIDAGLDARNPRTARRELPAGLLSSAQVVLFCAASLAVFLIAVFQLDPLVHWLWPIPVAGFVIYPYLKRWTWTCHLSLVRPGDLRRLDTAFFTMNGVISVAFCLFVLLDVL